MELFNHYTTADANPDSDKALAARTRPRRLPAQRNTDQSGMKKKIVAYVGPAMGLMPFLQTLIEQRLRTNRRV
jgi:hypothetical protein